MKLIKTTGNFRRDVMLAFQEVDEEVARAIELFPEMRVPHEGYAVIHEELDELWEVVKQKNKRRDGTGGQDKSAMRHESMQVAAMAIRFMIELT